MLIIMNKTTPRNLLMLRNLSPNNCPKVNLNKECIKARYFKIDMVYKNKLKVLLMTNIIKIMTKK